MNYYKVLGKRLASDEDRFVKKTEIEGYIISTVFLTNEPEFETMIFAPNFTEVWSARSSSREEALVMHDKAVEIMKSKLLRAP